MSSEEYQLSRIADSLARLADTFAPSERDGPTMRDMAIMSAGAVHEMEVYLGRIAGTMAEQGSTLDNLITDLAAERIRSKELERRLLERDRIIEKLVARTSVPE